MPTCERSTCYATNDRSTFLSTLPATRSDRTAALAIVGISAILFALAVPFAGCRCCTGAGLRGELPVGARGQRHHHRGSAAVAVRRAAQPRAAAAVDRLSVHGGRRGDPRPHLPRAVRPDRIVRCRPADHRLALHDLARRLSRCSCWPMPGSRTATAATGSRARRLPRSHFPSSACRRV